MLFATLKDRLLKPVRLDLNRAAMVVGVVCAAALTLHTGLAVARSGALEQGDAVRRISGLTRGEFTDIALARITAQMDTSAFNLALRHDPLRVVKDSEGGLPGAQPSLLIFRPVDGAEARRINGAIPFSADGVAPAAPFVLQAKSPAERERAIRCLANAVYYEAALEPVDGQRAVAQVVVNRLRDPNFPKSVCGVVYQGWERVTGCQFSFTCDGALVRQPIPALWNRSRRVAEAALNGYVQTEVGAATHYHADYVAPYWAPTLSKISQIGAHIFYRWPGDAGLAGALVARYAGGEMRLSEAVLRGIAARPRPAEDKAAPDQVAGAEVKTVHQVDPVTGEARTRVSVSLTPFARRQATPEEIAKINALLEARYPSKPKAAAPPASSAAPETPTAEAIPAVTAD